MRPTGRLRPDFSPSYGEQSVPYGIPVTVVRVGAPKVPVSLGYAEQGDQVPYPLSSSTRIEGGALPEGDRHAVVLDASTCRLYEYATRRVGTRWTAGPGATWDLRSDQLGPLNWTSADAVGGSRSWQGCCATTRSARARLTTPSGSPLMSPTDR